MNAIISVQQPFPEIETIRVYKRFRGKSNAWIYPVRINQEVTNVRISQNAMWIEKVVADIYSNELWDLVGSLIEKQLSK